MTSARIVPLLLSECRRGTSRFLLASPPNCDGFHAIHGTCRGYDTRHLQGIQLPIAMCVYYHTNLIDIKRILNDVVVLYGGSHTAQPFVLNRARRPVYWLSP